jgi:hypothetical protein
LNTLVFIIAKRNGFKGSGLITRQFVITVTD